MTKRDFSKVLVANRGEIAVRIIRTLHDMGISAVAVYSNADRHSLHVRLADEAFHIGGSASSESYLNINRIIKKAHQSGAQAIHPGYGFLSENAKFSDAVKEAGLVFIGPSAKAINVMGEKTTARRTMMAAGVPVVPGTVEPLKDDQEAVGIAMELGLPVMIKAAAGGGGKGMRLVHKKEDILSAVARARSEAQKAFGDGTVYLEKYLQKPRHVEFQILADDHGNVIHLFERECSVQRRHQKIIEETPSMVLDSQLREQMASAAIEAARAVDYRGAGTVEFLVDAERKFYFLEMNTRLQVEHPITEMVTRVDLVKEQVLIAGGQPISYRQEEITPRGSSIECRIYAENPRNQFLPSPGDIKFLREPAGPNVRVDSGIYSGVTVPVYYDPMIAKLVTWGRDRQEAIDRMKRCLTNYSVCGIDTNIVFLKKLLENQTFLSGDYDTNLIELEWDNLMDFEDSEDMEISAIGAAIAEYRLSQQEADNHIQQDQKGGGSSNMVPWKLAGRLRQLFRY